MKYEFGALQKYFLLFFWRSGGERTKLLHSVLALHICPPRWSESSENLNTATSNTSKLSVEAKISHIILVSIRGCLYRGCRISNVPFT